MIALFFSSMLSILDSSPIVVACVLKVDEDQSRIRWVEGRERIAHKRFAVAQGDGRHTDIA